MPRVTAPIASLFFAAVFNAIAAAQPATRPYAGPTTTPADYPKRLVCAAVRDLATAKNLSLTVETSERISPLTPAVKAWHEEGLNGTWDSSQTLRLRRPDRLAFAVTVPPASDGSSRIAPVVVFDGSRVTVAGWRDSDGQWRGSVGDWTAGSLDDALQSGRLMVRTVSPVAARLVMTDAESFVAENATDWTWLGGGHDSSGSVWRVGFKLPLRGAEPVDWEMWLSKKPPHRIVRVITQCDESYGFQEAKPGLPAPDLGSDNEEEWVSTSYRVHALTETRFVTCDTTTPLADAAFVAPAGTFRPTVYAENGVKLRVGATATLPTMRTADGTTVDFAHRPGPLVLDFWFAACPTCRICSPKVEALVHRAEASGATLYGVNGIDAADDVRRAIAREGRTAATLLDDGQRLTTQFDVSGYPTVIVLDPAGKILYRGSPADAGWMTALKQVLKNASGRTP